MFVANLYRVQTVFTGVAGSPYYSTFHFSAGFGSATAAVAAAGGFWNAVDGSMFNECTWDIPGEVEVIDDSTGNIIAVENATPQSGTGGLSAQPLPPATQGLIRWRTGQFVGGREIRGKTFRACADRERLDGRPAQLHPHHRAREQRNRARREPVGAARGLLAEERHVGAGHGVVRMERVRRAAISTRLARRKRQCTVACGARRAPHIC